MDKLPSLQALGEIVQCRRKEENLSQKALADLVGVSHVTVVALEKGTGKARLENAWKILAGLGLAEALAKGEERCPAGSTPRIRFLHPPRAKDSDK